MAHTSCHPKANETIKVQFKGGHFQIPGSEDTPVDFTIEDWVDHMNGDRSKSWMFMEGNPAALIYGLRAGINELPIDDEVVYGKVGHFGHMVHVSEFVEA